MQGGLFEGLGLCVIFYFCLALDMKGDALDTHHSSGKRGVFGGFRGGVCA